MEVRLVAGGGIPQYPYWKVVVTDNRAEVAELPCENDGSENLYYHEDLANQLRARHPDLEDARWSSGWLTRNGDEAFLRLLLVDHVSPSDVLRMTEALGDWCAAAGVDKLAIVDPSLGGDGEQDWELR